ncbi:MAG: DUF3365 domain-containing protein [Candidatus Competibacteraceae bacterium]|uniref:Tll0287-like domain-containing protein n=1 Tax=Candidatus Contendobacter odensis Run_B_J11 TaxID=1400861 RepID=A0A7U7G968_9GAMM|nr:DUF3365 domain-containing protein [Candidatus Contendobacter odensis]MBK8537484.1 DUF3365 domain-containing protein [Candidatus Competibacteraceae bacterium]MBK8751534.1 DUF3365 domain-containing protein [Candidatus Competibacteraceae bacterium]CDH43517.1 conserved exported hypothetical protein [Candidatus Contendobacter odensis Run_B_J11]
MRPALILTLSAALTVGIALTSPPSVAAKPSPNPPPEITVSRVAVQKFGATLKEALQQAMQSGGAVNGIAVCHDKAEQIATDLSQHLGILVGRTSLKIRNPANAPDNWEQAVLKQFDARKAQGEPVDKLEFFAVIDDDQGQKTFRYMKAIPTAALCLGCHGEHLTPEVDAKLKELYPSDAARGFREGDLRGAFTLAKPLP